MIEIGKGMMSWDWVFIAADCKIGGDYGPAEVV